MKSPFFSIVLPSYNRAHIISQTIESVLSQTYSNWELLVVDDDSFPNSYVIKKSIKSIQKFKYYNRRIDFSFQNNGESKNKESITLFPVRKHIGFRNESEMSAGTLKVNFNA